jgi:hypothetical protein
MTYKVPPKRHGPMTRAIRRTTGTLAPLWATATLLASGYSPVSEAMWRERAVTTTGYRLTGTMPLTSSATISRTRPRSISAQLTPFSEEERLYMAALLRMTTRARIALQTELMRLWTGVQ